MAMNLVGALARKARPPVYCLVGDGGKQSVRALQLDDRIRFVWSPRHATVLLVMGRLTPELQRPAQWLHDQLPAPRGTVVCDRSLEDAPFPHAVTVSEPRDVVPAIVALHRDLMTGERPSAPTLGSGENPVSWKGVGPYGQGGEGMMGGVPYGRSMAMTGPDLRDGLALDRVSVVLGPFLPWVPAGLQLELEIQGDVIQSLTVKTLQPPHRDVPEEFLLAQIEAVPVADLEIARARHHLGAVADLLFLLGLDVFAKRTLRLAARLTPSSIDGLRSLTRTLRRSGALHAATRGVGVFPAARIAGGGPNARAAGVGTDRRTEDPVYQSLGFESITQQAGDANARWQQRLLEAIQALELAQHAADRQHVLNVPLEEPGGWEESSSPDWTMLLSEFAPGQAWDEFVTTLSSLDLDSACFPHPSHEDTQK